MTAATLARSRVPVLLGVTMMVLGCASTPESRLANDILLEVYWPASKECEGRHRTLHVSRLTLGGELSLIADANSRLDAPGFRDCYWQGIRDRVEQRRAAGQPVPEHVNLTPDIDID